MAVKGGIKMSTIHWVQTIFDFVLLGLVILSFIYKPALIKWEEKQSEKMRKAFKKRREYRR